MIDIHAHILYGLDDGAKDEKASIEMLRMAEAEGIENIIATPHYIAGYMENDSSIVYKRCEELKKKIKELNIGVDIYPGNEVFIDSNLIEMFEQKIVCSLNNSRYILFELPMVNIPHCLKTVVYRARIRDYVPIIAHPERNKKIYKNPNVVEDLINRGALIQVNSGSLTGLYGKKVYEASHYLLEKAMIHFISSDAHSCQGRAPRLLECKELVTGKMGEEVSQIIFEHNAKAVLNDGRIKTYNPKKQEPKKKIFVLNKLLMKIKG